MVDLLQFFFFVCSSLFFPRKHNESCSGDKGGVALFIFLYSQSVEALHNCRLSCTPKGTRAMRETTVAKLKQLSLQTNCTTYEYSQANIRVRAFYIYFLCSTGAFLMQQPLFSMRLVQSLESEPCLLQHYLIKHRIPAQVNKP